MEQSVEKPDGSASWDFSLEGSGATAPPGAQHSTFCIYEFYRCGAFISKDEATSSPFQK